MKKSRPSDKKMKQSQTRDIRTTREKIRARANLSLAILGMAFVYHGSGKFLNIR